MPDHPNALTDERARAAYLNRQVLQVRHGRGQLACMPLWDDPETGRPVVILWTRSQEAWLAGIDSIAGAIVRDDLKPMAVDVIEVGMVYTERWGPARRLEVMALAARFELDLDVGYMKKGAVRPAMRRLRALGATERVLYAADRAKLDGAERGERVPKGALRSFRPAMVKSASIPRQPGVRLRWDAESGYGVDGV